MTLPAYPASLPKPRAAGYSLSPGSSVIRSDMDGGRARLRRRHRQMPTACEVNAVLRGAQASIFEGWWAETIAEGAQAFTVTLLLPTGLQTVTARGAGLPTFGGVMGPDCWELKWQLEILDQPRLSGADAVTLDGLADQDLSAEVIQLHTIVHVDYPATVLAPSGP